MDNLVIRRLGIDDAADISRIGTGVVAVGHHADGDVVIPDAVHHERAVEAVGSARGEGARRHISWGVSSS